MNVDCGGDVTIAELATVVQRTVGHRGPVIWDRSKPDGTPRKLLDISRLAGLGWHARVSLEQGWADSYQRFINVMDNGGPDD